MPCPALESVALPAPDDTSVGALLWITSVSQLASFLGQASERSHASVTFLRGCLGVGKANEQCSEVQGYKRTEIEDAG